MSRTINSINNIKYGLLGQILSIFSNFVMRMVFVRALNSEYLGINGLFTNIVSILSLAELGVGSAIIYSLYKPLAEKDELKIKALMNLYKRAYNFIGILVLLLGIILLPFLNFFISDMPNIKNLEVIYLFYVINSSFSYFVSYKRSLLVADQKKYIDLKYHYIFYLSRIFMQMTILLILRDFIIYLLVQLSMTIAENVFISRKVNQMYPFINKNISTSLEKQETLTIIKNVKALMLHKVGTVVVAGTDNLLISKFVGIVNVGLYSNYILIINSISQVFVIIFQSFTSSVGNLLESKDENRKEFIYKCIDLFGFWIVSFSSICLLLLLNPFISLWLGDTYLLSNHIVFLIVLSFYLNGMRRSVWVFYEAYGLYWYDRYKPIFESVINLFSSIFLATYIGIEGVILGTIISTLSTAFWIEPLVLFKYGFRTSVSSYFKNYFSKFIIMIFATLITWSLTNLISDNLNLSFLYKLFTCIIVPNFIYYLIYRNRAEFNYVKKTILDMVKKYTLK